MCRLLHVFLKHATVPVVMIDMNYGSSLKYSDVNLYGCIFSMVLGVHVCLEGSVQDYFYEGNYFFLSDVLRYERVRSVEGRISPHLLQGIYLVV